MNQMTSYDESGPLFDQRPVSFETTVSGVPGGKHKFEVPIYTRVEEESQLLVVYNGIILHKSSIYNNYYGFGTSPQSALESTSKFITALNGLNAVIEIVSEIALHPCFLSDEKPFYAGAQRVHHVPMNWHNDEKSLEVQKEKYVVWRNGARTPGAGQFYDRIQALVEMDQAPGRLDGLRSIISGRRAVTRDDFLNDI